MKLLIVGAGLTGAVIARILAESGHECVVLEESGHVAGNCHTEKDSKTGIMMHCFGPHTLHSDDDQIWDFIERFIEIYPYKHKKQAWVKGEIYPFPINLSAINRFFNTDLDSDQARNFLEQEAAQFRTQDPENFEQAALSGIGAGLYEGFYKGYTRKQWGREPTDLPPFIFRRLPIHLDDESNVYHHSRQGQPIGGYTLMVERMLDHPMIEVRTGVAFTACMDTTDFDHTFYSGPIDRYFGWCLGRLPYRTLDFKPEHRRETFQECGTVNYCDEDIPYTRVAEHKHFWPWEEHKQTVITYEFSRECGEGDIPYYPVQLNEGNELFEKYVEMAIKEPQVSFVGRLGTYRYLDMDKAIGEAMQSAYQALEAIGLNDSIPAFFFSPGSSE
ncbi:UDP-galactopyranose mutase [Amphritea balenae]|uniref:UDP-galactopyranose mutase n=1 Tax=Amphritea balenae TaxID=452629 RepID=A0A3P1ST78_9GAMM|nr:UDP-galactopyranose mutase [Amphritea balenae]RRD00397.1 UDP-galactopyranose mutase [Amphritea balenae]